VTVPNNSNAGLKFKNTGKILISKVKKANFNISTGWGLNKISIANQAKSKGKNEKKLARRFRYGKLKKYDKIKYKPTTKIIFGRFIAYQLYV